ncbi:MAG: N-acetyltransferase [Phycisphaerales bacterium]|nr:N-acetyltransferase [Phycisphaerales bacterium]
MAADGTTHRAWVYAYRGPLDQVTKIADGDYAAHCRLIVRAESPTDYDAIDQVNDVAFGGDGESRLIRALRNRADFDSGLSLVAEREGVVIGHILFTSIRIDGEGGSTPAQALAPMAVLPDWQNQGIGSRLVRVGLRMCRERRHGIVVVLGHPKYYPRFGFVPAPPIGIAPPFPVSDDAFMVCALKHGALDNVCGNVCYPREFDDVS